MNSIAGEPGGCFGRQQAGYGPSTGRMPARVAVRKDSHRRTEQTISRSLFLLCLFFAAAVQASDLTSTQTKEIRALYQDAVTDGDLWTAIQLEAYAKPRGSVMRGLLGNSKIFGQPLLAFPRNIVAVFDQGERIGVCTEDHYYLIAGDGRPLALATRMQDSVSCASLSMSGKFLATLHGQGMPDPNHRAFYLQIQQVPGGDVGLRFRLIYDKDENITGEICVAEDGSALAFGLHRNGKRRLIALHGNQQRAINDAGEPIAVGADAKWLIVRDAKAPRLPVLISEKDQSPLDAAARGPGIAAIIRKGKAQIVDADGSTRALSLPFGIGKDPSLATVGQWLAVGSGSGVPGEESVDALGNVVAAAQSVQQLALFRWSDLADAKQKASAVEVIENPVSIARNECAALYLWNGRQVELLDCSGEKPERRALTTLPSAVASVDEVRTRSRVRCQDGSWAFLDRLGRPLWQGKGSWCELIDPNVVVIQNGNNDKDRTYQIGRLSVDTQEQTTNDLKLEPGPWSIEFDHFSGAGIASRPAEWADFQWKDGSVGKLHRSKDRPKPGTRQFWPMPGRFAHIFGRLFDKTAGDDVSVLNRLHPSDAIGLGPNIIVLGQDHHLIASGRKPGDFLDLGNVDRAHHLMNSDASPVAVVEADDTPCALLVPGPKLDRDIPEDIRIKPFPGGRWRVNGRTFAAPGANSMVWDEGKAGFDPMRLRCAEDGNMLVITASLVIELDPAIVKLIGDKG